MEVIELRSRFARCHLLVGSEGAVLVDAGSGLEVADVTEALSAVGLKPRDLGLIVLTHGDGDHIAGAARIQEATGADVLAHALEIAYIAGRVPRSFPVAKRMFGLLGRRLSRPTVTRVMTGEGQTEGEIEVIHAPGHTPGHIVVFAGDMLIAGDAFRTGATFRETPAAMTVDRSTARETIKRLAERPIARAYSGHGPPSDNASAAGEPLDGITASLTPP